MIGREARAQILAMEGRLPDRRRGLRGRRQQRHGHLSRLPRRRRAPVRRRGAAARTRATRRRSAEGRPGVLHGAYSYLLQDDDGQVRPAHSISAGLDYPGVGPEHSAPQGRGASSTSVHRRRGAGRVRDSRAAARASSRRWSQPTPWRSCAASRAGRIASEASSSSISPAAATRTSTPSPHSGRGRDSARADLTGALRTAGRKALVPFLTAGYPDEATFAATVRAAAAAGADVVEIGIPFSDPIADGPVIQARPAAALARGMTLRRAPRAGAPSWAPTVPVVVMSYLNPDPAPWASSAFADAAAPRGRLGRDRARPALRGVAGPARRRCAPPGSPGRPGGADHQRRARPRHRAPSRRVSSTWSR